MEIFTRGKTSNGSMIGFRLPSSLAYDFFKGTRLGFRLPSSIAYDFFKRTRLGFWLSSFLAYDFFKGARLGFRFCSHHRPTEAEFELHSAATESVRPWLLPLFKASV